MNSSRFAETIYIDTREKPDVIKGIVNYFIGKNVKCVHKALSVGDYMLEGHPEISVDRKHNLGEVALNLVQDHDRFKREIIRANEQNVHLIILIEHSEKIKSIDDVRAWKNPRLIYSEKAVTGERLATIMETQQRKYGIEYRFCDKRHTGEKILEALHGE